MTAAALVATASWSDLVQATYVRNAFVAGTATALAAGLVGWFVVLRNQVFAGDALSHMAFTGGLAALAFGADLMVGVYGATIVFAVLLAVLGLRSRQSDVAVGVVFAWILGLGAYFLSVFTETRSAGNSAAAVKVLFGSVFGISADTARVTVLVAVATVVLLLLVARPLLFATIDPLVATSRGLPVVAIQIVFLMIVAIVVAQATQVVGSLLVLALVATPAATASMLTTRPFVGMWLSAAIAVAVMWLGLVVSYWWADVPPSFVIVALAATGYAGAFVRDRRRSTRDRASVPVSR